ncbi:TetR/AcrR family transcriptional regulator [Chthonobacter rhizosphaerae]|uniref:TetR/AcrR family transcriptional regulator n=1 Tax=Chthonobacter rhizosphaerae TaxID=2735553 RepID=UPI0015EE769C|nr:TetR/AcrR family transcriptional regulator [Chthonobacter rhizosphaerae]
MIMQDDEPKTGRRGEAKRDAILKAAQRCFLEDGFAVSVDRIAAEADVSKQTIYSHFGSKEGLYRAMALSTKWPVHEALSADAPLRDVLVRFGSALLDKITAPETIRLHRLLIGQAGQFPDLALVHHEIGPQRSVALLADHLRPHVEAGRLSAESADVAADHYVGLLLGTTRQRLLFGASPTPTAEDNRRAAERAADVFLKAYG